MPISTQCPKCQKLYKLKDELLGKRVTCASASCRSVFEVKPYVPPGSKQHPKLDAEAVALAALKDDPDPIEAVPEDQRKVAMSCNVCDHKFEVAWALQGKNTVCPECKSRLKVPEQKAAGKVDWKNINSKRPTLAKQEEVPDDVWGANKANVSVQSMKEAGAIKGVEYEPRPMSFWIKIGSAVAVVLALSIGGLVWMSKSKKDQAQLKLVDEATADFATFKDANIPPNAAPQFKALFSLAAAEYHARQNTPNDLKAAMQNLTTARTTITSGDARGGDRELILGELVMIAVRLGGDVEAVKGGGRIPWQPSDIVRRPGVNTRDQTVASELQTILQDLQFADADYRFAVLRRLVGELEKAGRTAILPNVVTNGFKPEEQLEATAIVALERARFANNLTAAADEASQLKSLVDPGQADLPAACHALWLATNTTGAPKPPAVPSGQPSAASRMAYVMQKLAQNQPAEALAIAKMAGPPEDRLKALALVAEVSPQDAVTAAVEVAASKPAVPSQLLARLARAAGAGGSSDDLDKLLAAIPDEGSKAWARGDALRAKAMANPTSRIDDATTVDDPKKVRAGHAWAKLGVARQNAKIGVEVIKDAQALASGTLKPFAFWGIVLGTLDKAGP
jgi:hypothetical protein